MHDVIILGAGAAGLSAGIFASRRSMKALILSKDLGGQAATTPWVENYPGFRQVDGFELMQLFEAQAKEFGVEVQYDEVVKIEESGNVFSVSTEKGQIFQSRALILAFGKTPRNLGVPGEKEFRGRGVTNTPTDAPKFIGKKVVVVGGGNSALDSTLLLSKTAKEVFLVHRRDQFRGFESTVEKLKMKENIHFILNSVVVEIRGDEKIRAVVVEDVNTKVRRVLEAEGVFVNIGSELKLDMIKDLVKADEKGRVIINHNCETSHPGIFAAGDLTQVPFKQIVISAGEGAKAALQVYNYLHGIKEPAFVADWAKKLEREQTAEVVAALLRRKTP